MLGEKRVFVSCRRQLNPPNTHAREITHLFYYASASYKPSNLRASNHTTRGSPSELWGGSPYALVCPLTHPPTPSPHLLHRHNKNKQTKITNAPQCARMSPYPPANLSQLPVVVVTEALDGSVVEESAGVLAACGDFDGRKACAEIDHR